MIFIFSKNIFCERLKDERTKRKLTQAQVGENFSFPKQYISRWEKGEQEPNLKTLVDLADYFNVSLDYLTGRTNNPEINK